jgi:hypothetical protein
MDTRANIAHVTRQFRNKARKYDSVGLELLGVTTKYRDTLITIKSNQHQLDMMVSELVVAINILSETALFVELVKEELFETPTNLMLSNEYVTILNGMIILKDMQSIIEDKKKQKKSLKEKVGSLVKGNRKWKGIGKQLFHLQVLKPNLMRHAVTHIKKKVYTTCSLDRVMDPHRGFNLCVLDHLRLVEPAYFRDERMLWLSSRVKKEHIAIDKEMMREINIDVINDKINNKVVDGVRFDVEHLFHHLVTLFGLAEKAKRGKVEFAITRDGAPPDDLIGYLTIGFEIMDKDAVCPIRGKNIFHQLGNMQADKWCFTILMILAKDDKATYDKYLRDFLKFCEEISEKGLGDWKPFKIADPQDMKSLQLCLTRGGAPKGMHFFCHLCQLHSDDISLTNQVTCCYGHGPKKDCYHKLVVTVDCIQKAREEHSRLEAYAEVQHLTKVSQKVKMGHGTKKKTRWAVLNGKYKLQLVATGKATSINNNQNLVDLARTQKLRETMDTLGLWKENCDLSQPEQVELVHCSLHLVCRMQYCQDVFDFEGSVTRSIIKVQNTVPCILHLHKCMIEKIMSLVYALFLNEHS